MAVGEVIYCIGDSHVSFFSGFDRIQPQYPEKSTNRYTFLRCFRLGAVLAYSLNRLGTREQGRERLLDLIKELPSNSTIIMCFGEIDCRCHLVKQAELTGCDLEIVVNRCVDNYFQVVDELKERGFNVMLWNVVPTSDSLNGEYPYYGSHTERNLCTIMFNQALGRECEVRGLIFISIFDKLIDKKKHTKRFYFFDNIHLGQIAFPYFVLELRKYKQCISFGGLYWLHWRFKRQVLELTYDLKNFLKLHIKGRI